jgi:hypothetical protein
MPTKNGKPSNPDLGALIEALTGAGVEFIIVGGLAAVVQGAPLTTMDVDIVHNQSDGNIARLFRFLKSVEAIYRRPDDKIIKPHQSDFAGEGHVLLDTHLGPLDVLSVIEEGNGYEDLLSHAIEMEFKGRLVRVLSLEKMIDLKERSTDPLIKRHLPILKEVFRQSVKQ